MKKNKMMRLASFLLIAVLVSTSAISGTYAKYVTEGSAEDSARVAKWGVTVVADGSLFAKQYFSVGNAASNKPAGDGDADLTVKAEQTVVAPGTKSSEDGLVVQVKGQPEVNGQITRTATVTLSGWEAESAYYCPLIVTINGNVIRGLAYGSTAEFKGALEAAIVGAVDSFKAGDDLTTNNVGDLQITWEWPFEGDGNPGQTDAKDTVLGNAANATIKFDIAYLIEQVD